MNLRINPPSRDISNSLSTIEDGGISIGPAGMFLNNVKVTCLVDTLGELKPTKVLGSGVSGTGILIILALFKL